MNEIESPLFCYSQRIMKSNSLRDSLKSEMPYFRCSQCVKQSVKKTKTNRNRMLAKNSRVYSIIKLYSEWTIFISSPIKNAKGDTCFVTFLCVSCWIPLTNSSTCSCRQNPGRRTHTFCKYKQVTPGYDILFFLQQQCLFLFFYLKSVHTFMDDMHNLVILSCLWQDGGVQQSNFTYRGFMLCPEITFTILEYMI